MAAAVAVVVEVEVAAAVAVVVEVEVAAAVDNTQSELEFE